MSTSPLAYKQDPLDAYKYLGTSTSAPGPPSEPVNIHKLARRGWI